MSERKRDMWLDLAFIVLGIIILLLLFMPAEYYEEYRRVGYFGVGLFLSFIILREIRRKKKKKESGEQNDEL